jgi:vacuolar-type H+-ATPase subunit F/Vma7
MEQKTMKNSIKHVAIIDSNSNEIKDMQKYFKNIGVKEFTIAKNRDEGLKIVSKSNNDINEIDLIIINEDLKEHESSVNVAPFCGEDIQIKLMQDDTKIPVIIIVDRKKDARYDDDNTLGKINLYYENIDEALDNILNNCGSI